MFEIIFVLVIVYVGYLMFKSPDSEVQSNTEEVDKPIEPESTNNESKAVEEIVTAAKPTPSEKPQPAKAQPKPKAKAEPKTNKLAAPKIELRTVMMKNPATGEEAKVAGNYRMVKRWIKEALVEEGLLEKIYKNNELDDAAKLVVAEALSIIKAMDKYKA
ncbi:hypothetical protein [Methyloprofundus sp.]|uniref:hypothetical protein n=1 Tax=Methyloprofundus sp. TaxID=2020875 RepID=UPI003D0DF830